MIQPGSYTWSFLAGSLQAMQEADNLPDPFGIGKGACYETEAEALDAARQFAGTQSVPGTHAILIHFGPVWELKANSTTVREDSWQGPVVEKKLVQL